MCRTKGETRVYDEDEESVESTTTAEEEEDNDNSNGDSDEDNDIPSLQDREREDSESDSDSDDDDGNNTNNIFDSQQQYFQTNTRRRRSRRIEQEVRRNRAIDRRIAERQAQTAREQNNETRTSGIPSLICRIDKEDSSDDDQSVGNNDYEYDDDEELYIESSDDEADRILDLEENATAQQEERLPINKRLSNLKESITKIKATRVFGLEQLDEDESMAMGGSMGQDKFEGNVRISTWNPNGINLNQVQSTLQQSLDLSIDVQGYSEVNTDFLKQNQHQGFKDATSKIDNHAKAVWGTSQVIVEGEYKPGGTALVTFGKTAGRVKESGTDPMGRWTYQILDGKGDKEILIMNVYQCCKSPTNPTGITAYHQQTIMLSELDKIDTNPRRNFRRDLMQFIKSKINKANTTVIPIIMGDWNEECKGSSTSQLICNEFGLVDAFQRIYPDHRNFKTYNRGSRRIDFILTPTSIADKITNFVYEPFMYRLTGDHRGVYFDISEKVLFGNEQEKSYDPDGRSFSSKDPKAVTKYLQAVSNHLKHQNVYERVHELMKSEHPNHEEAERIDREITQACQHGATECRRRPLQYWSVELHELKRDLSVYCQLRRRRKKGLSSTALIARTSTLGLGISKDMTNETIDTKIKNLRKYVIDIHKKSKEKRDAYLLEQANISEDADDKMKAKALRLMRLRERQGRAYSRFAYHRNGGGRGSGINRLQVPQSWPKMEEYNEDNQYNFEDPKKTQHWREINCPKEIEFSLRLRNQRHFGQAESEGTPFTTPRMKHRFNWSASTSEAELVLEGKYTDEQLTDTQRLMLDNMTRVTEAEDNSQYITDKEFVGKFKVWRESTSTSPSGRHLGHYKALVSVIDKSIKEEEEREDYKSLQRSIRQCHIGMINYCMKHRYSLLRWKTVVNMMIYKEPGNVKIHRLRVIHLYEADLSLLLGVKWRTVMQNAVQQKTLHQGQYGGLPGRDCTSLTYLEELRFDCAALTRRSLANFDNDATACYDRILMAIASLSGRKYGIHKNVIFVHAKTLEEAEFKLKISTKVSNTSYKHCIKFPIHGTGQGSSNSPMIWCFISCILFDSHEEQAHGILFETPDQELVVKMTLVGFVDDSTSSTGANDSDTLQDLIRKMKEDAQLWHDLLWCSGGKLELSKCGYHIVHYNFDDSGIPRLMHHPSEKIILTDAAGGDVTIGGKNIYQTRTNLGHDKSPGSNGITHYKRVLKKGLGIAEAIVKCGGTRDESRMYYDTVWRPAVEYTLSQSFLSDKQLKAIEKACLPKIISKCGYNRMTSRAILGGPANLTGGGIIPLVAAMGAGEVLHFVKNWRTPQEDIGKVLRIVYAWNQYQAGVSFPLLEQPDEEISYLQGKVIPSLRKYLSKIDGKLTLDRTYIRKKLRTSDIAIMDIVRQGEFTAVQEHRINCVRLFLGVMYFSEICSIDGMNIRDGITTGKNETEEYVVSLKKARQHLPNTRSWNLWKQAITSVTIDGTALKEPLGDWTIHHSKSGQWKTYQRNRMVYESVLQEDGIRKWKQYKRRGSLLMPHTTIDRNEFDPATGIPVSIRAYPGRFTTRSLPCKVVTDAKTRRQYGPTECWDRFISSQPTWIRKFLEEVHFYTDDGHQNIDEMLIQHDKFGQFLSVSDGSVKFHNMSFGWIIATPDGRRLAAGSGPCEGRGNSLRSEGAGMLAATLFMALISHHMNHQIKATCISDNKELIRRMTDHKQYKEPYPNATLASEYDIIEEIYETCNIYNLDTSYSWVRGHQDKNTAYNDLSLNAQLNVDADWYAGKYQDESGKFLPQCMLLPACPVMLSIRDISVTSDYKNQLIRAYTEPRYIEHLQNKFGWSDAIIGTIAWKSLSLAARRLNSSVLLTKVCNDLLPTAETLKKYKYQNSDKCVLCDRIETRDHMIQCKAASRVKWRISLSTALRKKMKTLTTNYEVEETFMTALCDWMENNKVDRSKFPPRFKAALKTQDHIGWRHVFSGKISQHWLKLQGDVQLEDGKVRNDYIWGASILEVILGKTIALWKLRNEEVHGATEEIQETRRKHRLIDKVKQLNDNKDKARPADMGLFHADVDQYIEDSTARTLANYISSHSKAIKNSVAKWANQSEQGTRSIVGWIRGLGERNNAALDRIQTIQRDKLLGDGRKKERRRRNPKDDARQTPIERFLSLTNRFD